MELHYATIWESIADTIPGATAVVHGDTIRTWAEYDERAARLASAFAAAGLGHDSKIGLYMYNGNEYLEAQYAGFKVRGVPVNVNYRYLDDELWYLLDNADAEALVCHSSLGDRVAQVVERLPKLKLLIEVDDGGSGQVAGAALRRCPPRTADERIAQWTTSTCSRRDDGHAQGRDVRHASHVGLFLRSDFVPGQRVPHPQKRSRRLVAAITEAGNR